MALKQNVSIYHHNNKTEEKSDTTATQVQGAQSPSQCFEFVIKYGFKSEDKNRPGQASILVKGSLLETHIQVVGHCLNCLDVTVFIAVSKIQAEFDIHRFENGELCSCLQCTQFCVAAVCNTVKEISTKASLIWWPHQCFTSNPNKCEVKRPTDSIKN